MVFLNGQKLQFTDDWSISGTSVTVTTPLLVGDEISIEYFYSTPDVVNSNLNGTGTGGYLTKWNGTAELGVSLIQDSGSVITLPSATDIGAISASSDTDKFLVLDSNRIKYRTGAQTLSDIGGQEVLVSGTNIKTVGGESVLGSGNIDTTSFDFALAGGRYHFPLSGQRTGVNLFLAGTLRFIPFYQMMFSSVNMVADRIGVSVSTAGAGTSVRLGIFEYTNNTMTLVDDCGTVDTSTTGIKELTINVTLTKGKLYMLGAGRQGTSSVNVFLQAPAQNFMPFYNSNSLDDLNSDQAGWSVDSGVTGAFAPSYTPTGRDRPIMIALRLQNV